MFDHIRADLRRHLCCDGRGEDSIIWSLFVVVFAYGFQASTVYRYGRFIDRRFKHGIFYSFYLFGNVFYTVGKYLTEKMYGIHIDRNAVIAEGLYIGHFGGVVIANCHIGKNCNVHQHVKIGDDCILGDNIWVGAHAVLEKGVKIDDHATIMVGAKVSSPVSSRCLASGNPARIINKKFDNNGLLGLNDA